MPRLQNVVRTGTVLRYPWGAHRDGDHIVKKVARARPRAASSIRTPRLHGVVRTGTVLRYPWGAHRDG